MHVCMHACMWVCMYVCMYVSMYVHSFIYLFVHMFFIYVCSPLSTDRTIFGLIGPLDCQLFHKCAAPQQATRLACQWISFCCKEDPPQKYLAQVHQRLVVKFHPNCALQRQRDPGIVAICLAALWLSHSSWSLCFQEHDYDYGKKSIGFGQDVAAIGQRPLKRKRRRIMLGLK